MVSTDFTTRLRLLINREGEDVAFVAPTLTPGAQPWEVTEGAPQSVAGKAYLMPVEQERVNGTNIKETDSIAYMVPADVPAGLDEGWAIQLNSQDLRIIELKSYKSAGVDIIFEAVVRG